MKSKPSKTQAPSKAKPAAKTTAKAAPVKAAPVRVRNEVTMTKLKEMAKDLRIKGADKMDRAEMIHTVQVAEGHAACYARIPDCGQMDCLFRPDCLPGMA